MTEWLEDFKTYLPKYLSAESQRNLFAELKQFPNNIDGRLYTIKLRNDPHIYQGDGLAALWVADLPNQRIGLARVMVLSNTCDLAPENKRLLGRRLLYCPIISFTKLENLLKAQANQPDARQHLDDIRMQHNSAMFYLPKNDKLGEEGIALLDRINNCDAQKVNAQELVSNRLFTLSDYGFYLFLFKLSLHLTRIRENMARS